MSTSGLFQKTGEGANKSEAKGGVIGMLMTMCGAGSGETSTVGRASGYDYERLRTSGHDGMALFRLQEAVQAVNMLLPAPITLENAVKSADGVRRLVKGQTLAKMYSSCLRKLECLSQHVPGTENPALDAVMKTHAANAKRMADTCAAALLHMYMAVDSATSTDAFVEHAITLTAATEAAMQDVALAERALGLQPLVSEKPRRHTLHNGHKMTPLGRGTPGDRISQKTVTRLDACNEFETRDAEIGPMSVVALTGDVDPPSQLCCDERGELDLPEPPDYNPELFGDEKQNLQYSQIQSPKAKERRQKRSAAERSLTSPVGR
nr:tegument protein UL51 [Psittacid alphaherpesvirus 6]